MGRGGGQVAVNIKHIYIIFLMYLSIHLWCTQKPLTPGQWSRRLTMLTCTMFEHLHIPELIPIV